MSSEDEDIPINVEEEESTRERIEREAERAIDGFDAGIVDMLGWLLETETRSRIYISLRRDPWSTSEEVAEGTGIYPSTVREALAELHEDGTVTRRKREHPSTGNNPFEYQAIPPSDLVSGMVSQLQDQLNTVVNLDTHLRDDAPDTSTEPITISVDDDPDDGDATDDEDR